MSEHTLGPLRVRRWDDKPNSPDSNLIETDGPDANGYVAAIAQLCYTGGDEDEVANLFAAAPDLLAELECIKAGWETLAASGYRKLTDWEEERLAFIRVAIAKARGE